METLLERVADEAFSVFVLALWTASLYREKRSLMDKLFQCVDELRMRKAND